MEFRKKPVVIEAFQFTRRNNVSPGQPDWFHDAVTRNDVILRNTGKWNNPTEPSYCEINTLEGVMRADEGDWIIRGIKGEIYPCKPDIFTATYEAATPPSPSTAPIQQDQANVLPPFAAPAGQQEVTRLDLLSLIHSQCHRVYASAIDREEIDTKYMAEIEDELKAVYADAEVARRCRAQGGNTSAKSVESGTAPTVEVDERAAFEAWGRNACGMINSSLEKSGDRYLIGRTADMWATWQARAALASKPPAREAAERQSIFTDADFRRALMDLIGANQADEMKTLNLIVAIDTWGGAAPAAGNTEKPKEDP